MTALEAVPSRVRTGNMMDAFTTRGNRDGSACGAVPKTDPGTSSCVVLGDPWTGPARGGPPRHDLGRSAITARGVDRAKAEWMGAPITVRA